MQNVERENTRLWIYFSYFLYYSRLNLQKIALQNPKTYEEMSWLGSWFVTKRCLQKWPVFALQEIRSLLSNISLRHYYFHRFKLAISLAPRTYSFFSLKRRSGPKVTKAQPSPCTTRSLLIRCPRDVWERAGESLSVTSQLKVESSFLGLDQQFYGKK